MKKALKILAWTILGILALVVVLVLTIPLWLGPTVASVANKVAPGYTGTRFHLEKVGINPYSGRYSLGPLFLGNPDGYAPAAAFAVSNVLVDVEMSSLFTDTIHIREIRIEMPYASYVSLNGTNNFEWIGAHVAEKVGPKKEKEEKDEGPGKKVVIDLLTIADARAKFKVLPEMPIPTIVLKDIGKEKGGATWAEVGKSVADAAMAAMSSMGKSLNSALGLLGGAATNVLDGATKALGGAATNVLGGATKALDGATKKLGDLGSGFLGGEKKDGAGKAAGSGAIGAGKAAGKGVLDAGKAVGNGAIDAGKAIGNGAIDAGKAVGEGLKKLNPFGK